MLSSIFGPKGAFKSLTFWGVIGALGGTLVQSFDPSVLPGQVESGLQIAGTAIAVLGLRKAHNKAVAQVADLIGQLAEKRRTQ